MVITSRRGKFSGWGFRGVVWPELSSIPQLVQEFCSKNLFRIYNVISYLKKKKTPHKVEILLRS